MPDTVFMVPSGFEGIHVVMMVIPTTDGVSVAMRVGHVFDLIETVVDYRTPFDSPDLWQSPSLFHDLTHSANGVQFATIHDYSSSDFAGLFVPEEASEVGPFNFSWSGLKISSQTTGSPNSVDFIIIQETGSVELAQLWNWGRARSSEESFPPTNSEAASAILPVIIVVGGGTVVAGVTLGIKEVRAVLNCRDNVDARAEVSDARCINDFGGTSCRAVRCFQCTVEQAKKDKARCIKNSSFTPLPENYAPELATCSVVACQ